MIRVCEATRLNGCGPTGKRAASRMSCTYVKGGAKMRLSQKLSVVEV